MRKLLGLIASSVLLAGCSGPNTNISTIQFSGSTEALPANFAELATKAVEALPVSPGPHFRRGAGMSAHPVWQPQPPSQLPPNPC
jgi:hypothetical protein